MKTYKPHPAAKQIPLMKPAELKALAASIITRGQIHPIVLLDGMLLDGRNRLEACRMAELEPKTVEWHSHGESPTAFVEATNLHRRSLSKGQIAMAIARLAPFYRREAKEARIAALKRGRSVPPPGRHGPQGKLKKIAEDMGVEPVADRTMERAVAVAEASPELADKVFEGDVSLKQAERQITRAKQVQQAKAHVLPEGEYPVIVIDPPWRYDDALDGSDAARGGTPYPTMSIDEIAEMKLPLAADCAVFLWVTNSHLVDPAAYAIVVATWKAQYGLVPKQIRTWVKPRMGLGRYWRNDTEHLVLLVRGKPVFAPVTQTTSLMAPLAGHSTKPQQAFDDIAAMCPAGPKLELFARAPRPGWVTSGSELAPLPLEKSLGRPLAEALFKGGVTGEVVPTSPENLGDLTGTKFGEQLAKHAAKKRRLSLTNDVPGDA